MKKILFAVLALAPLLAWGAHAQQAKPAFAPGSTTRDLAPQMATPPAAFAWAYPVGPAGLPRPDPTATFTAQGADPSIKLTMRQIGDSFGPPDWFPKEHAPLPQIVGHGRSPHVVACTLCHLPNGNGHPESASISGLTAPYIIAQMHAFRDGERTNIRAPAMIEMALDISDKELREAAAYFAHIPKAQQKWIRVVETSRAPANHIGAGGALAQGLRAVLERRENRGGVGDVEVKLSRHALGADLHLAFGRLGYVVAEARADVRQDH